MTSTIPEIRNTLDEGITEIVMVIVAPLGRNEVKVRSGRPDHEVRALTGKVEPNKGFVKLLTPLLAQFHLAYHLRRLIT